MQKSNRKTTKILAVILFVIIVVIAILAAMPFILSQTVREYRTIQNIPAPRQVETSDGMATISGDDWKANMQYLAKYEIEGLVVGIEDYNSGSLYDRAAPRDISLAWGDMAAHNNLVWWQRDNREMSVVITKLSEWIIGKTYDELVSQYSNNHLIPKDQLILSQIKTVERGDYIKLTGYLVNLKMYEKDDPFIQYELKSSLVRNDEGEHACEVMYVTNIQKID